MMNTNEIKKALECCCSKTEMFCTKDCPLYEYNGNCWYAMRFDALAYINQLEAENKAFGKIIKKQDDEISVLRKDLLKRQNLEENFSKVKKQFDKKMLKQVKFERADAVKEFAERLNHYLVADTHQYYCKVSQDKYNVGYLVDDVLSGIDRIKKEMVGDKGA